MAKRWIQVRGAYAVTYLSFPVLQVFLNARKLLDGGALSARKYQQVVAL